MTHYNHILTVNRLSMQVHLGFYDSERSKRQTVEISARLYFPQAPAACEDDHAAFLDYGALCDALEAWASDKEFRLVEYMGKQAFAFVRAYLDARNCSDVKLWLQLHKCTTPLPNLKGGAYFVHSDLPPGSSTAYTQTL